MAPHGVEETELAAPRLQLDGRADRNLDEGNGLASADSTPLGRFSAQGTIRPLRKSKDIVAPLSVSPRRGRLTG